MKPDRIPEESGQCTQAYGATLDDGVVLGQRLDFCDPFGYLPDQEIYDSMILTCINSFVNSTFQNWKIAA